jgi:hypothetical protein
MKEEKRGKYKSHPNEYPSYVAMKGRCLNPNKSDYKYYGGRGIGVCKRWEESFDKFMEDMGPRPKGTTLDRIDVHGDYSPTNCRWASWEVQANNRGDNNFVSYRGLKLTLAEWSRITGVGRSTISYRLKNEFTTAEALGYVDKPSKSQLRERRQPTSSMF